MPRSNIMAVVNITPDSFSDGGKSFTKEDALANCRQLVEEGADILDLGAESTRPGATPLSHEEEWARLSPVLSELVAAPWLGAVQISVDTRHAETAKKALELGAHIINDVSGLTQPAMCDVLAQHQCPVIVMHALSIPASKTELLPENTDMVAFIKHWQSDVEAIAVEHGIAAERLIYDPGVGFGKSPTQSLQLLTYFPEYAYAPEKWLIGHSKKSLFSLLGIEKAANRSEVTLCASAFLFAQNAGYLRVHDVATHKQLRDALV